MTSQICPPEISLSSEAEVAALRMLCFFVFVIQIASRPHSGVGQSDSLDGVVLRCNLKASWAALANPADGEVLKVGA